jgi:hypothetical protein
MNGVHRLPVAPETVVAVLLADGWHRVASGSFTIGALSFGDPDSRGVLGYRFEEISEASPYGPAAMAGPLEALLAVRQITPRGTPALAPSRRPGLDTERGRCGAPTPIHTSTGRPEPAKSKQRVRRT